MTVTNISLELTEDWIDYLSDPINQSGFMWVMAGHEMLPEGVDPNNERVIVLCQQAKEHYLERRRGGNGVSS